MLLSVKNWSSDKLDEEKAAFNSGARPVTTNVEIPHVSCPSSSLPVLTVAYHTVDDDASLIYTRIFSVIAGRAIKNEYLALGTLLGTVGVATWASSGKKQAPASAKSTTESLIESAKSTFKSECIIFRLKHRARQTDLFSGFIAVIGLQR